MDLLLETEAASFGQAARFVLDAANLIDPDSASGAFALARQKGWLPEKAPEEGPITTGELAFLIMKSFDMKGSFLYRLFPGPRYAFRELDYRGLLPGRRDPGLKVSGEGLLRILGMTSSYLGRGDAEVPDPQDTAPEIPAAEIPPPSPREQREQIVREIRTELNARHIADTTVRAAEEGIVISLNNIQFMPDDTELTEGERMKLMRIGVILAGYPGRKILVGGHTALAGTAEGRTLISTRRAQAVADFLVFLDIRRPEEIVVRGYGAEQPLAAGDAAEERALNRRVEIILLDE
jgi:outer membrane protein OmpA-like peptidoglycan-associated protein